jgi:hypothetical protein
LKRVIAILAIVGLGLAGFAGTCNLLNFSLTTVGANDVYGAQLQNNTGANFLSHSFKVAFVDANGNVVDTKFGVPGCLRSWQNGASDFFSVRSVAASSTTVNAIGALDLSSPLTVGTTVAGNSTLSNITSVRNATSLAITGTLRNNDTVTLQAPSVCVVVYDSSGNVIITSKLNLGDLAPNTNNNFTVPAITVPDNASTINHFSIWSDGLENNVPTNPISVTGQAVTLATATPTSTATATPCVVTVATATSVACTATATPTATSTLTPTATATNTATATPTP